MIYAVQYLEGGHDWSGISDEQARSHLRAASKRLPIEIVAVGWDIPERLLAACSQETERMDAKLYRWQPLLTSYGDFQPLPEWQTVNLNGSRVAGYANMPEFTFICPNQPGAQNEIYHHMSKVLTSGKYQGVFLDRIRFPAPGEDLINNLACFCPACQRMAEISDMDLNQVKQAILDLSSTPEGAMQLVKRLLSVSRSAFEEDPRLQVVDAWLDFRQASVSRLVNSIVKLARALGLSIGLDCFSPRLCRMVGQDLTILDDYCDWIKIMTYGRTFGPAGLPFELSGLANWLIKRTGLSEAQVLSALSDSLAFDLPQSLEKLRTDGLASQVILSEVKLVKALSRRRLLGGIALVELEGMNQLTIEQIWSDTMGFLQGGADGLMISWDLWHIPIERLNWLRMNAN